MRITDIIDSAAVAPLKKHGDVYSATFCGIKIAVTRRGGDIIRQEPIRRERDGVTEVRHYSIKVPVTWEACVLGTDIVATNGDTRAEAYGSAMRGIVRGYINTDDGFADLEARIKQHADGLLLRGQQLGVLLDKATYKALEGREVAAMLSIGSAFGPVNNVAYATVMLASLRARVEAAEHTMIGHAPNVIPLRRRA